MNISINKECRVKKRAKMSYKMFQPLNHASKLPHIDFMRIKQGIIIIWKIDGQARGPPNTEQPIVAKNKKKPNKNSNCDIMGRILINQKHNSMIDVDVYLSQLNLWHEMYVVDTSLLNTPYCKKTDLDRGGIGSDVPLMDGPIKIIISFNKAFVRTPQETIMGIHDNDKYVPDIPSDILIES